MKDKSGRELQAGDLIVYGHLLGRCAGLQYGKVLEAKTARRSSWDKTMVERVRIRGVGSDWREPKLLSRDSTLSFGDRILKLWREQVEPRVLNLLDGVASP
jgi:hypothetical protein